MNKVHGIPRQLSNFLIACILSLAFAVPAQAELHWTTSSPERTVWLNAQLSFAAASPSHRDRAWMALIDSLATYVRSTDTWANSAARLRKSLTSSGASGVSYAVNEWQSPVALFRIVTMSDGSLSDTANGSIAIFPSRFSAQVLFWQEPRQPANAQTLWTDKSVAFPGVRTGIIPDGRLVADLRAWQGDDGIIHLMTINDLMLEGSDGPDPIPIGLSLPGGSHPWMVDSTLLPLDVFAGHPPSEGIAHQDVEFTDRTGHSMSVSIDLYSTLFVESHCCPHVTVQRVLTRHGDHYASGPWHTVPSPYATIIAAITIAKQAEPLGCTPHSFYGKHLLENESIAHSLCSVTWATGIRASGPDTYPPNGPVVFTVVNGPPPNLALTLVRQHGVWLISSVHTSRNAS